MCHIFNNRELFSRAPVDQIIYVGYTMPEGHRCSFQIVFRIIVCLIDVLVNRSPSSSSLLLHPPRKKNKKNNNNKNREETLSNPQRETLFVRCAAFSENAGGRECSALLVTDSHAVTTFSSTRNCPSARATRVSNEVIKHR